MATVINLSNKKQPDAETIIKLMELKMKKPVQPPKQVQPQPTPEPQQQQSQEPVWFIDLPTTDKKVAAARLSQFRKAVPSLQLKKRGEGEVRVTVKTQEELAKL